MKPKYTFVIFSPPNPHSLLHLCMSLSSPFPSPPHDVPTPFHIARLVLPPIVRACALSLFMSRSLHSPVPFACPFPCPFSKHILTGDQRGDRAGWVAQGSEVRPRYQQCALIGCLWPQDRKFVHMPTRSGAQAGAGELYECC